MADISKIQTEQGIYNIKDQVARDSSKNLYIGTFFDETLIKTHFLTSLDGINWSEFNTNVNITGIRDPQITYNNGVFYLAGTGSGDDYNCVIYTSSDFETWEIHQIDLGYREGRCWAPELFFDGDNTYLLISIGGEDAMKIHLFECDDLENLTFNNDRILPLNLDNVIDPSLIKYNGVYYLTVKNDDTAKQLIYLSTNLLTFSVINSDVLGMDVDCEGGQLLNINDRWYFYGDTWQSYGFYGYMQTDDITNFGYLIENGLNGYRHGSVLLLEDKEALIKVTSIEDFNLISKVNKANRLMLLSGNYDKLVVMPNFIYRINGTTNITKIVNPYNLQFLPVAFTTNSSETFTLPLGTSNQPVTITNSTTDNERLMIINLQDTKFINGGRIKKTINIGDLLTINDSEQYDVTLYNAVLSNNMLHIDLNIVLKVDSPNVEAITFKAPYRPLVTTALNNDKSVNMFIRSNGTISGSTYLTKDENSYCYVSFEIE